MNPVDPERGPEIPAVNTDTAEQLPLLESADSDLQESDAPPSLSQSLPPLKPPPEGLPPLPPSLAPVHSSIEGVRDSGSPLGGKDLLYLLLFYLLGAVLLNLVVAAGAIAIFHVPFSEMKDPSGPAASVAVVAQALLSFAMLAFLYVLVRVRTGAPFWQAIGWRAFPRGATVMRYVFLGLGLALAVSFVSRYLDNDKTLPMEELFHNRQTVLMLMVLGILVAPFVEETVFRGCLYPVIARKFGVPAGIVATGILFGAAHMVQLWGGWGQIALLMVVGIVLTYVRARAGTVAASYLVHVTYNSILFVGLFFATGGLKHFPTT